MATKTKTKTKTKTAITPSKHSLRLDDQFYRWQETHGKSYGDDPHEYEYRLGIFAENTRMVETHNKAHAEGLTSFAMTIDNSPFADLTDDEFRTSHLMEPQNCSATTTHSGEGDFLTATE
jgi:hypothetical protein